MSLGTLRVRLSERCDLHAANIVSFHCTTAHVPVLQTCALLWCDSRLTEIGAIATWKICRRGS